MVTYRIYKKCKKTSDTVTANQPTGYNSNIGNILNRSEDVDYYYKRLDWDEEDLPFTLCDSSGNELSYKTITVNTDNSTNTGEKQSVIVTNETFTEEQIKNGTDGKTPYVTTWGMKLKVDSSKLGNDDLTNYMITVTYVPYDATATDEDGNEIENAQPENDQDQTLYDYFIFTVAKLKTDM